MHAILRKMAKYATGDVSQSLIYTQCKRILTLSDLSAKQQAPCQTLIRTHRPFLVELMHQ